MFKYFNRVKFGSILMALTGVGILFVGAVPLVCMCGGFSEKNTSMWDSMASMAFTFMVGAMIYAGLSAYLIINWLS